MSDGAMTDLLRAATISCSGLQITIDCPDHCTKEAIIDVLSGINTARAAAKRWLEDPSVQAAVHRRPDALTHQGEENT
jgi:hypothetical protein